MPYNNLPYGGVSKGIVWSLYFEHSEEYKPSPPPGEFYLLNDNSDFLLDDSEDYLVTP